MSQVCPLGLCRTEAECPNVPCLECMRRLGEHMIEEIRILERQSEAASLRDMPAARSALDKLLESLGLAMTRREQNPAA